MTDRERLPWVRVLKANLERGIPGPWDRDVSLSIDWTIVLLESAGAQ